MNASGTSEPIRGTATFAAAQVAALGAGFATQSFAARSLSHEGYGRFAVLHTIIVVSTLLLVGALPRAFAREVSLRPGSLGHVIGLFFRGHVSVAVAYCILMVASAPMIGHLFRDPGINSAIPLVALVICIHATLVEPLWYILNGLRQHRRQAVLMAAHGVIRFATVAAALLFLPSLRMAIAGIAAASLVSAFIAAITLRRSVAHDMSDSPAPIRKPEAYLWFRYGPLVDLIAYLLVAANLWIAKATSVDARQLAVYAACFVFAQANLPLSRAVAKGYFSYFAKAHAEKDWKGCSVLQREVTRLLAVCLVLQIIGSFLVGRELVQLLCGTRPDDRATVVCLMTGSWLMGCGNVYGELLAAAAALHARFLAAVVSGVAGLILYVLFVSLISISAAAAALLCAGFISCSVHLAVLRRCCPPRTDSQH